MRVLVCGTKGKLPSRETFNFVMNYLLSQWRIECEEAERQSQKAEDFVIIEGCCKDSADQLAEEFAKENNIKIEHSPSDSNDYLDNNIRMVEKCDVAVGFWDGRSWGTCQAIAHAVFREKRVYVFNVIDWPDPLRKCPACGEEDALVESGTEVSVCQFCGYWENSFGENSLENSSAKEEDKSDDRAGNGDNSNKDEPSDKEGTAEGRPEAESQPFSTRAESQRPAEGRNLSSAETSSPGEQTGRTAEVAPQGDRMSETVFLASCHQRPSLKCDDPTADILPEQPSRAEMKIGTRWRGISNIDNKPMVFECIGLTDVGFATREVEEEQK